MKSVIVLLFAGFLSTCQGSFLFPHHTPKWDGLKVTWKPPGTGGFTSMPRTVADAMAEGFMMVSDCGAHAGINGKRYVKGGDYAVVLLYDVSDYIAGIQIGFPKNDSAMFPPASQRNHPFILMDNMYLFTAYFTDPTVICTTGRTEAQFVNDGTGEGLFIQNGTNPGADKVTIPMEEAMAAQAKWMKGSCFPSMGIHYWYNVREDMNCDYFFPMFALYNGGKLNGLGWVLGTNVTSPHLEHPTPNLLVAGLTPLRPRCLLNIKQYTVMHIYLTSDPRTENNC